MRTVLSVLFAVVCLLVATPSFGASQFEHTEATKLLRAERAQPGDHSGAAWRSIAQRADRMARGLEGDTSPSTERLRFRLNLLMGLAVERSNAYDFGYQRVGERKVNKGWYRAAKMLISNPGLDAYGVDAAMVTVSVYAEQIESGRLSE